MSSAERRALYETKEMESTPQGALLLEAIRAAKGAEAAVRALRGGEGISVVGGVISLENKQAGGEGGNASPVGTPQMSLALMSDGSSLIATIVNVLIVE